MKKVLISFSMPQKGAYVGGVASIIKSYRENKHIFNQNGCEVNFFDFQGGVSERIDSSFIKKIVYGVEQIRNAVPWIKKNEIDIFHIHTSRNSLFFKDVLLGVHIKKKTNAKVVLSIHVGDICTVFEKIEPFRLRLISYMNRYIDKVVFLSNEMREQFVVNGLEDSRCAVLYNFHNMQLIREEEKLDRTAKLHLIYVGAIHREKGVMELLSALCNLKDLDFHLDLCGQLTDHSIELEFKKMVEQLGDKITICGYVSGTQKAALYERADILILPSYHEGLPLVILEGLSQGCALISTKVGATPEILNEENVVWVDTKSTKSIEQAIRRLGDNSDIIKEMQTKNKLLRDKFGIEEHIAELCKLYGEL